MLRKPTLAIAAAICPLLSCSCLVAHETETTRAASEHDELYRAYNSGQGSAADHDPGLQEADIVEVGHAYAAQPDDTPLDDVVPGGSPIGSVSPYAGPRNTYTEARLRRQGWMFCHGQPLAKANYPLLYRVIGTAHGNGSDHVETDFNLPDYRGLFVRGVDSQEMVYDAQANDRVIAKPGGNSGRQVGSLQQDSTRRPRYDAFSSSRSGRHRHNNATNPNGNHGHGVSASGGHNHNDGGFDNLLKYTNGSWSIKHVDTTRERREPNLIDSRPLKRAGNHRHSISSSGNHRHGIDWDAEHTHKVSGGGDPESRPVNAYVEWIIKVRHAGRQ